MAEMVQPHPVGGVDYPKTFQQFAWRGSRTMRACLNYLAACGGRMGSCARRVNRIGTGGPRRRGGCVVDCGRQTSVTAGTIFHRTRTPLSTWFAAVWFITSQKNGVSALGLQRVLGFGSYRDGVGVDAQAAPRHGPARP